MVIEYFLLRRLFDARLAFWAATLTLLSDLCWQFTLSGLPQMFMLLLFNAALYAWCAPSRRTSAVDRRDVTRRRPAKARSSCGRARKRVLGWLAATGVLFGLLALSHALAVWFFVGLLVFSAVHFRRRGPAVLVMLAAFAVVCAPWLVRNVQVSGHPFGVAGYTIYDGVGGTTADADALDRRAR